MKGRANMEGIERIHELIDELQAAVQKTFPEMTTASVTMGDDDYRYLYVLKWDGNDDKPVEDRKRVTLFDQSRTNGEWGDDCSNVQNDFLKKIGCLLGGADDDRA